MLEGQNYLSQMGRFDVYKKDVLITSLFPEKRKYNSSQQITTEAAIYSTLLGDLYIAIGDQNELNEKLMDKLESGLTHLLAGSGLEFFSLVFSGLISVIRTLKESEICNFDNFINYNRIFFLKGLSIDLCCTIKLIIS